MLSQDKKIISYSRAKEIVTAYENQMIEENFRNNRAREEGYDKGHEEGFSKGHEEGLAKGHAEGIEQGIEQGLKQGQVGIAQSMLAEGIKESLVSKITGLSLEKIEKMKIEISE